MFLINKTSETASTIYITRKPKEIRSIDLN